MHGSFELLVFNDPCIYAYKYNPRYGLSILEVAK
jgi:hypothetical protein